MPLADSVPFFFCSVTVRVSFRLGFFSLSLQSVIQASMSQSAASQQARCRTSGSACLGRDTTAPSEADRGSDWPV